MAIMMAMKAVMEMVLVIAVGAVPAVTALGNLVLVRRGGLFGAFLVGAVLWRLGIWLLEEIVSARSVQSFKDKLDKCRYGDGTTRA